MMASAKENSEPSKKGPNVGSVVNAIEILRYLSNLDDGAGVTAIANKLSMNVSSCFNILKTLVTSEFLEFSADTKTYRLGLGAIDLARKAMDTNSVYPAIRSKLRLLSEKYNIACGLWQLSRKTRFILVAVSESEQATRIQMSVGQRLPLWAGAIGRCFAMSRNFSTEEIEAGVSDVRWHTPPVLSEYIRHLEAAKSLGWSMDPGMWRGGMTTIAAPILDKTDDLQFVISGSMFTGQHDHIMTQMIGNELRETADYAAHRIFGRVSS